MYITGPRPRIAEAFAAGVDYVQLRAKDMPAGELFHWASRCKGSGKLLINDRMDVALAAGADGVHLPSHRPPASAYRAIAPAGFTISVSCHSPEDVERAAGEGADFTLLAPIFSTPGKGPALGLRAIEQSVRFGIPVFALGGVTRENCALCMAAGAAGIAAIRMFESEF